MPGGWAGSDRRSRLPADWPMRRQLVEQRAGGRCEAIVKATGQRCRNRGRECDHVIAGDDHGLHNLQWLCTGHHKAKTQTEALAAKRAIKERAKRPAERHPGSIRRRTP